VQSKKEKTASECPLYKNTKARDLLLYVPEQAERERDKDYANVERCKRHDVNDD